jgi:hypothetical protein
VGADGDRGTGPFWPKKNNVEHECSSSTRRRVNVGMNDEVKT